MAEDKSSSYYVIAVVVIPAVASLLLASSFHIYFWLVFAMLVISHLSAVGAALMGEDQGRQE